MATARKRGDSWRVRVLDHTEYDQDGKKKKVYKSITSRISKRDCEAKAAQYLQKRRRIERDVDVRRALDIYIETKTAVLSPSTISAYRRYVTGGAYRPIETVRVADLTQMDVQRWVSSFARTHSPKYTKNVYILLSSALDLAGAERMRITLPSADAREIHVPTDAELSRFVESIADDPDLRMAVMLAAFGSLRRSEICALTPQDVHGNTLRINKSMVRSPDGGFIIRHKNKTAESSRETTVPAYVIKEMDMTRSRIVMITPDRLTDRFRSAIRSAGLPESFTLHSLRHYYVSIAHAIGVSDAVVMKSGGWRTDAVMKKHYRTTLADYEAADRDKMMKYFTDRHGIDVQRVRGVQ